MGFGISFGKNKTKTNETSTVDKTETTNQTQTGTQNTQTSGSSNTSSQQNTQQSTSDRNIQTGTAGQQSSQQQQTTNTSQSLSSGVLAGAEDVIASLFQSIQGGNAALNSAISNAAAFDANQFVTDAVSAATAAGDFDTTSQIGQLTSAVGGTAATNSQTALLQNQLVNQNAANIAGVRSQAGATAAGIQNQNLQAISNAQASNPVTALINSIRGGLTTETGTGTTTGQTQQQTSTAGANTGTQSGTSTGSESTQTVQSVLEQLQQILSGTTRTQGTETTTGTSKKSGGGLSLGL